MSLWNTLVVSFLQNFWNKKKKIKNSNLRCLWNPLQSFQIPLNVLLIFHIISWITFAIINKFQSPHLIFFKILCVVGLSQIWLLLTFLCSVLIFSIRRIAVWPFARYFIDSSFVTGYGSLSELDLEGFKEIVSVLNQFDLEKDQIIWMSYNEIYLLLIFLLFYHTTIFWGFCTV